MEINLKFLFYCAICISVATPSHFTDKDSLIVSTETPGEESRNATRTKETTVPLVPKIYEMKVNAKVSNRFATTSVVSKVKNFAKTAQEATFSVVLPDTAYISGFVMEIDGKNYTAYVKEKEEAKEIYNQALDQGLAAAHVEANARDSNRFTVSVNVEPQKKAIFTLTYEELLQRRNDQYEIVINIHPGQPVKDLNVEVYIYESRPIKFVKSPPLRSGNEISKNDDDQLASLADIDIFNATSAAVKFNPDIKRQKQLADGLGTKEENGLSGQFVVQYDVERDPHGGEVLLKDGYFVHFFAPSDIPPLPKQVIFVLDTSGSMSGIRIKQLKEAMNSILLELKNEDLFNIVEFNSVVKVWNIDDVKVDQQFGEDPYRHPCAEKQITSEPDQVLSPLYKATEENTKKAQQIVDQLNADGGTNIKSALEVALKLVKINKEDTTKTHQPIIIFLTDGEPTVGETNPEEITSSITRTNRGVATSPIFSLSFGDGADRDFLQKISLKNLGFARHIYEAADASLQLQEFYKQISSPLLSDVAFKYISNATRVTKRYFPIFFGGSELVVAGIADEPALKIQANGIRGPLEWVPKVETPVGDLERLWAYLTIKQILEAGDAAQDKSSYTKHALEIALKYSFVTPVSSLVVVKPNDTSAVETQDASKSKPSFGAAGYPGVPLQSSGFLLAQAPQEDVPQPLPTAMPFTTTTYYPTQIPLSTTYRPCPSTTTVPAQDPFADVKKKLPWLSNILSADGTLSTPSGNYKLNETIATRSKCPETPINDGAAGLCTPLTQCPEVFVYLTDVKIFNKYFCPLDIYVGICCPTTSGTS